MFLHLELVVHAQGVFREPLHYLYCAHVHLVVQQAVVFGKAVVHILVCLSVVTCNDIIFFEIFASNVFYRLLYIFREMFRGEYSSRLSLLSVS